MKIYIQTLTHTEAAEPETRPRVLVLETAAAADTVNRALSAIAEGLGRIAAIPAVAHETNLKSLLPRDLESFGVCPGPSAGGHALLRVIRQPGETGPAGQADVTALSYEIEVVA